MQILLLFVFALLLISNSVLLWWVGTLFSFWNLRFLEVFVGLGAFSAIRSSSTDRAPPSLPSGPQAASLLVAVRPLWCVSFSCPSVLSSGQITPDLPAHPSRFV